MTEHAPQNTIAPDHEPDGPPISRQPHQPATAVNPHAPYEPAQASNELLHTGINSGYENADKLAGILLKPKLVRLSLEPHECTKATVQAVANFAKEQGGALLHLLVTFDGEFQTTKVKGEKISKYFTGALLNWKKMMEELAGVTNLFCVEMGNETSYGYQYGDGFTEASYKERAREYALLVQETAEGLTAAGLPLPSCQADDGNSGSSVWVDEMYAAVPNLHTFASAWTIHPYPRGGGDGEPGARVTRLVNQTAAHGGNLIPIDMTEWGIATDNGNKLNNETAYTYAEAAQHGEAQWGGIVTAAQKRLRAALIFQVRDQRVPGTGENYEWYFGCLQHENNALKGAWSEFTKRRLAE